MSPDANRQPDAALEAYLDGRLTAADRQQFERRLAAEPALRAAIESQRRLDETISRLFAPPSADAIVKRLAESNGHRPAVSIKPASRFADADHATKIDHSGNGNGRAHAAAPKGAAPAKSAAPSKPAPPRTDTTQSAPTSRRRWLAAAAILLLVGGAWGAFRIANLGPDHPMLVEFRDRENTGWKDDYHCDDMRHFAVMYYSRSGHGLILPDTFPAGVQPLGLCITRTKPSPIPFLIGLVDDARVAVFVQRADQDATPPWNGGDGLQMHRTDLGPLILYELSPFSEPRLSPLLKVVDVPREWLNTPYSGG